MQIGMMGLGRMGASMVRRLLRGGHQCVVFDRKLDTVKELAKGGAIGATSLEDFVAKLKHPRAAWLMVPAAAVDDKLHDFGPNAEGRHDRGWRQLLRYRRHPTRQRASTARYSLHRRRATGGLWVSERGYCLMIGGEAEPVRRLAPIFKTLAPVTRRSLPHASAR